MSWKGEKGQQGETGGVGAIGAIGIGIDLGGSEMLIPMVPSLPACFYGLVEYEDGSPVQAGAQIAARGVGVLFPDRFGGNPIELEAAGKWGFGPWARKLVVQQGKWQAPLVDGQPIYFYVNGALAQVETPSGWVYSRPFTSGEVTEIRLRVAQGA